MPSRRCQSSLSCSQRVSSRMQMGQRMLREEVTAADIAEVTAKWTGIPVLYMQTEHCRPVKRPATLDLVSLTGLGPVGS
jgi:ATP-dependent Clp protease ATP-binding subunit ClpA